MPDLWIPGIPRLECVSGVPNALQGGDKALHTWHTFEGIPKDYNYAAMTGARYLKSSNKLAHFTFNPVLGGLVQLLPANVGARTLRADPPNRHTNAFGKIHMQTEVLANAARPWTLDLTREGLDDLTTLMNFLRSWGIPDQWAWGDMTRPAANYAEANAPGYRGAPTRSGHAVHSRWWANSHWDPGAISAPWSAVDRLRGFTVEHWMWVQESLVTLDFLVDPDGDPVDGDPGPVTIAAVEDFQRETWPKDPSQWDGLPGPMTTAALKDALAREAEPAPQPKPQPTPEPEPAPVTPGRLAGENRYHTAAMLAMQAPAGRRGKVYLAAAGGDDAATAAAAGDGVVLLARPGASTLPGPTAEALSTLAPVQLVIVGGTSAIPETQAHTAHVIATKENA